MGMFDFDGDTLRAFWLERKKKMGMFDYLRCEVPLPDGYVNNSDNADEQFQTKCFICEMHEYVITKDGRLKTECVRWECDSNDKLKRIVDHWYEVHFCGFLYFYGCSDVQAGQEGYHEYEAEFVDSKLVKIEVVRREDD